MLTQHRADLLPTVDLAQLDLPARHEAEEQDERRVLGGQRALRLHASSELLVEPLNRVRGSQRLPLGAWEPEEREQFVTAFPQTRHHAPGRRLADIRSKTGAAAGCRRWY